MGDEMSGVHRFPPGTVHVITSASGSGGVVLIEGVDYAGVPMVFIRLRSTTNAEGATEDEHDYALSPDEAMEFAAGLVRFSQHAHLALARWKRGQN